MYKSYNINYTKILQSGGNDIITYVPEYPENLGESRSIEWPPTINESIKTKDPISKKDFNGIVVENIWNETASVIKIDDENFVESSLRDSEKFNNGKGYFLLLPDYVWESSDQVKVKTVTKIKNDNYDQQKGQSINIVSSNNIESDPRINVTEFNSKNDETQVLKSDLSNRIPINQEIVTNNELYKPLLAKPQKDYFSDIKLDISISSSNGKDTLTSLDLNKIQLLGAKLNKFENIDNKDIFIVVNKNIALNNLIEDPNDEINEGSKIIKWIDEVLKQKVFTDLITRIHEGYVYITRKGIDVVDNITNDLVDLKHFKWQDGNPINYDTLKYVIFQNKFQQNIEGNIEQKKEAEDILSQEYIIALQPSPLYQLWALKRLIMIWYSDPLIEKSIRKIKVLINQYRCDPNFEFNKKNGILGSILIYPKYGVKSTKELLSKIEYYFSLYIDENSNPRYQDVQWINSSPSYFIKKNSLIYYTNGSIELKNYMKYSLEFNSMIENNTLTKDYTEFIESNKIMGV